MSPQRTCIGCRRPDEQGLLVRLVRVGDEVLDGTAPRLPGRGAYLHPQRSCLDLALKRGALRRTFGPGAQASPELVSRLAEISPGWKQTAPGE